MGFFAKAAIAGKAGFVVQTAETEYLKYIVKSPSAEPYEFMVPFWEALFRGAGKEALATCGREVVQTYGCMPSPLCIRMMAYHVCYLLMPEFRKTHLAREWSKGMQDIWKMQATFEAERLNNLFKGYNPNSCEALLTDWGGPPFDKESMQEHKRLWENLDLG